MSQNVKLDRCPEHTYNVPRVEETHKSHTKGLFKTPYLKWEKRIIKAGVS